jgi:hypothetical protein
MLQLTLKTRSTLTLVTACFISTLLAQASLAHRGDGQMPRSAETHSELESVRQLSRLPIAQEVEAAYEAKFGRPLSGDERQRFYIGLSEAVRSTQTAQLEMSTPIQPIQPSQRRLIDAEDPNEVTVWMWCFGANVGVVASGGARLCYSAGTEQKWHTVVSTNVGHVQASIEATWISLTIPALARASVRGSYRFTGASFAILGGIAYYSFNEEGRSRLGTTFNTTAQARRGRVFAIQAGGGAGVAGVSSNDTLIID